MLSIVQLGSERLPDEGIRIGTVRRPPRGVKKERYQMDNWFDRWLPPLSPSKELLDSHRASSGDEASWKTFERKFRLELSQPDTSKWMELLALLSHSTNFSIGCYCEDEQHCHRVILGKMFTELGAAVRNRTRYLKA